MYKKAQLVKYATDDTLIKRIEKTACLQELLNLLCRLRWQDREEPML